LKVTGAMRIKNRGSYKYKISVFWIVSKSLRSSSYFRDFPCI